VLGSGTKREGGFIKPVFWGSVPFWTHIKLARTVLH